MPKNKRYLASSEGAFSYLAKSYGLKELYIWSVNNDEQGTTKQIKYAIDTMKKEKIPVIFSESTISPKPAQTVANESKAKYGGVLYVDSLSKDLPTYIDMMKATITTILNGINQNEN